MQLNPVAHQFHQNFAWLRRFFFVIFLNRERKNTIILNLPNVGRFECFVILIEF